MTLQEALNAKRLMHLVPFEGYKPCRGCTGLFYYDTVMDDERDKDAVVQIKTGIFPWDREWVPLSLLKEVKGEVR